MSIAADPALAAEVAAARRRLVRGGDAGTASPTDDRTVQLSVRVPNGLRDRVHRAASAAGTSTQVWLERVVAEAVDRALTPEGRAAAVLAQEVRRHLADAVRSGTYHDLVRGMDDPDLV